MKWLKIKLALLQAWLFVKNPKAFFEDRKFNKGVNSLEKAVKRKALNAHDLKLAMNQYARKKRKQGKLNDFQMSRLLKEKFKPQLEELNFSRFRCKNGLVSRLQ